MKHVYVTVRYADDKAVVTNSQKGLQQLMDNLNKVTREFGMKINVKKTKAVCISYTLLASFSGCRFLHLELAP